MPDVARQPNMQVRPGFEGVQVNAFVFDRAPQPLDENIVLSKAPVLHVDLDASIARTCVKAVLVNYPDRY